MSEARDARGEEREPEGPRASEDAREPEGAATSDGSEGSDGPGGSDDGADRDPGRAARASDVGQGSGRDRGPAAPAPGDVARDAGSALGPAVGDAADGGSVKGPRIPGDGARGPDSPRESANGPARLRGLVMPHGPSPKHTHAGNGTVKHGLDERGPEGLDSDEAELRALLHRAVRDVEPADGTLDHLRRAVPARRARKRQALVGMAAAALFLGTAVPAAVHVSRTAGSDANPSAVGHASQAQGGNGPGKDPEGGESTAGGPSDKVDGTGKDGGKDEDKGAASTGTGAGASEGADPSAGTSDASPVCTAAQLGPAVAGSAAPDSTGAVYGSFRVTNVSAADCTVDGPGGVAATAQGAASADKVSAARHMAGDAAAGLPDPSLEAAQLVLKAGAAYEVRFAWVPSETCPTPGDTTGGGTGGPTTQPTPSDDPTTTAGTSTGADSGTTAQLVREDGTEGSVVVTYTASTGSSSATATVANACAGTVYWTGLLTPVA